jgi:hypothetical protein
MPRGSKGEKRPVANQAMTQETEWRLAPGA